MGKRVSKRVVTTESGTIVSGGAYCYRTREGALRASRRWSAYPCYVELYTADGTAGEARWLACGGYIDEAEVRRSTHGLGGARVEVEYGVEGVEGDA